MNQLDIMNHALRALDGPGVELWSEMPTDRQSKWREQYAASLDPNDTVHEQAMRAYNSIYARDADRNKKLVGIVLG